MQKKKFFIVMAALVGVSLVLAGCPTDAEAGPAGVSGKDGSSVPGTTQLSADITAASLQKIVDAGGPILISGDLEIGAGYVDLKTASVTVDAALTFASGSIVNARSASVVVGEGSITGTGAVIIPPAGASVWDSVTGHTSAGLVSVAEFVAATGSGSYAVESLSVNASGIGGTALATATGTKTVYVLGTLAIDATTAVDTDEAKLVALGETTAAGTGGITFGDDTVIGTLKATGELKITEVGTGGVEKLDLNGKAVTIVDVDNIEVITSGATGAALTLPADGGVGSITVGAYDIAIGGTPAAVTVAELATPGAGKLVLPKEAVTFTATAGGGKIAYKADPASLTLSSVSGLTYVGDLSVTGNVSLVGNLTVSGTAAIGGTLANSTAASVVTFNGATTVTGAVTSGTGGLTIGGTGLVTLVESASGPTTSTAALKIASTGGVYFAKLATGSSSNTVALTKAVLVAGDAEAPIELAASGSGFTLGSGDVLALDDEGTITIASSGAITITGFGGIATTGSWTADTSTGEYLAIAVGSDKINIGTFKQDGTTAANPGTLTVATGGAITVSAGKKLVIGAKTEIALAGNSAKVGEIVLTHNATPAKIVFAGAGAKISTGLASGTTKVTAAIAGGIVANSGTVGAKLEVYSTATTGNSLKLGSITPASDATFDGTDNVITGPTGTANTSIDGTLTVTAA